MKRQFHRMLSIAFCVFAVGFVSGCGDSEAENDPAKIDTPEEIEADLDDQQRMMREEMQ